MQPFSNPVITFCPECMYWRISKKPTNRLPLFLPMQAVVSFDNKYYIFAFEKDIKCQHGRLFHQYLRFRVSKL